MSIPFEVRQESNISNYNLNINNKLTSNNNNPQEIKKLHQIDDIRNHIVKEIYFFKDDILKEMNEINGKLIIKFADTFKEINQNFSKNEKKFEDMNNKIDEVKKKYEIYDKYEERINELYKYKLNNEKEMNSHKFILNAIKNEIKEGFQEYDYILKKFRSTQEIVGEKKKFQTYPELIRFLFQNMNELNNFQKKNNLDFRGYKEKLDATISTFRQQINVITDAMRTFTINSIKDSEERIKGILKNYDERIVGIRCESNVNAEHIKKECEKLFNENIKAIKDEFYNKIKIDFININELFQNSKNQLEEEISEYKNDFISLKNDFQIIKSNEDKFIEKINEQVHPIQNENNKKNTTNDNNNNKNNNINNNKNTYNNITNNNINNNKNNIKINNNYTNIKNYISNNKNNNSNNNNIINSETKENFIKEEKSETERNYLNSNKPLNNISHFIESFHNLSKTIKNKTKKNSFFNFSNNNLKSININKNKEIKEEENGKEQIEIIKSNDRYNLGKSKNEHSRENVKKIASLKNSFFKKENINNNINNTIYRIRKINKHNSIKEIKNYFSDIKDNNIKVDLTSKSTKNLFDLKDKPFPILNDSKKGETKNKSRDLKFSAKIKEEKKNNTSFYFHRNSIKSMTKRIMSTKNRIIQNNIDKDNHSLNLNNTFPIKKCNSMDELKLNSKINIYDVTYIPYKDYDRNKILEEKKKKSSKNLEENNIYKKIVNNNNKKGYNYINSKGEISNVIEMPPPKDVIFKRIYKID